MSKQTMDEVWAPIDAHYKNIVIHQTFGHLYPDKEHYEGKVIIAVEMYCSQNPTILDEKDLPQASPWWYDAITEFAYEAFKDASGNVYEVDIKVDIVQITEELEQWEIDEEVEPKEWSEIHISEVERKELVSAYD